MPGHGAGLGGLRQWGRRSFHLFLVGEFRGCLLQGSGVRGAGRPSGPHPLQPGPGRWTDHPVVLPRFTWKVQALEGDDGRLRPLPEGPVLGEGGAGEAGPPGGHLVGVRGVEFALGGPRFPGGSPACRRAGGQAALPPHL